MTDETHPPAAPVVMTLDRWQLWFFRIVQVAGLAIILFEARPGASDRQWLLLAALAMTLGGLGIELVVRALLKILPGGRQ